MLPFQELATDSYIAQNKMNMYIKYTQDGEYYHDHNLGLIFYSAYSENAKLVPYSTTNLLCRQKMTMGKLCTRQEIIDYIKKLYSIDNLPFNYWIQIPRVCEINLADLPNLSIKQFVNTIQLVCNQDPNYFKFYSRAEHCPMNNRQTIPKKYVQLYPEERLSAYQLQDMLQYAYGELTHEQTTKLPDNVYTLADVLREVKKASNLHDIILGLSIINPIILMEKCSTDETFDLYDQDADYKAPQFNEYMTLDQL